MIQNPPPAQEPQEPEAIPQKEAGPANPAPRVVDPALAATLDGEPGAMPRASTPSPAMSGERYEIIEMLGKGGMGVVFKARDRRLGRTVALKFIRAIPGDDGQMTRRFMQEARAQARIEHDHVCKVYEVGEVNGHAFIAMQFISGRALSITQRQMALEDKIRVLATIAEAVHAAHSQGVIHRDIKPSNIMVECKESGAFRPVIMDFGLAHDATASHKLTQHGALLGTPQYMPPEQARAENQGADRRSDVYSLGAVLYELLCNQPPFVGDTVADILLQVLEREPLPLRQRLPNVPPALATIAHKCLQKEPAQRYDSARALAEDLRRYLDGEPILGRQTSLRYRASRWARKRPAAAALAGVLLLSIMVFTGLWLRSKRQERESAAQAQLAAQLGQDVKEMELFMRVAYGMPLHDVTAEKALVRQRMRDIEQRAARTPSQRRGPAEYALGRGYLALREYQAALPRLQGAWNAGYRVSEVHYALGRTLGELYKLKLEEVERASDRDYRQRERRKLEAEYLTPARAHMQQANAVQLESTEYVEGLLALYSQRYEQAIEKAAQAMRQRPWQYEARVLAGDAWTALGIADQDRGKYVEAQKSFDRAAQMYQAASELARSDGSVYESEINVWAKVIENLFQQGATPNAAYAAGVLASERAIQADPNSINAYEKRLNLAERWSYFLLHHGDDVREVTLAAARMVDVLLRLGKGSAAVHDTVGAMYAHLANYELAHGLDPQRAIQRGRESYQKAIAANPNFAWPWNDWAALEVTEFEWLARHGGSSKGLLTHLEHAAEKYKRSLEVDPGHLRVFMNLTDLYVNQARFSTLIGQSPAEAIKEALAASKHALEWNDRNFGNYINLSLIYLAEARHLYLSKADPRPDLGRVYENTDRALKLKVDYPESYQIRAEAHLIAAYHALVQGGDVASEIAQGLQALADHARHSPNDARDETLRARLLFSRARWLIKQRMPVGDEWEQTSKAAARAIELDAEDPDAHLARAELARYQIELRVVRGPRAEQLLADGLAATEQALQRQPWNQFAQAAQAALCLLHGLGMRNSAQQQQWQDKGRATLAELLRRNALLEPDYGHLLSTQERKL